MDESVVVDDKPSEEQELLEKLYAEAQPFWEELQQQEASPVVGPPKCKHDLHLDEEVGSYCKRCDTLVTAIRDLTYPVLDRCPREPSEAAALRRWKRLKKEEERKERAAELRKRSRKAKKIDARTALLIGFAKMWHKTSTSHETSGDSDESLSGDD